MYMIIWTYFHLIWLAGAEIDLIDVEDREYVLRRSCKIRRNYDYIIMDCPPS